MVTLADSSLDSVPALCYPNLWYISIHIFETLEK